jgi:hypothetical protein
MSGNISSKVNLASLKNATILKMGKSQIDCIIIPIEQNHLYKSEKGAVYLDMQGFPLKTKREGSKDTHMIVQSLPKEIRDKQTDEEKKSNPILGNHIVWDESGNSNVEQVAQVAASESDLPF